MLIRMQYQEVLDYKSALADTLPDQFTILGRPKVHDLQQMGLAADAGSKTPDPNRRVIEMRGTLFATEAGRVFGEVKTKIEPFPVVAAVLPRS